eukprot:CAMPEP_0174351712 /NCGR_PEP_ID=MMETSP0811_2-20130205/9154_1 /TAXON_ID=73025 ORGANISM="Eutreptiella gymnastica-like, Strain CCMP1594" /NCGR_SAMPLE_ID=MMETSP0811_2 /ASSEMBLY_ACC=CAM_ASM_000667 /LENGTH=74 /DNA_ID=CAMNT_0015481195 /DNA_START=1165 /DNA_END=1389 /DNA_ORIENTATION=-
MTSQEQKKNALNHNSSLASLLRRHPHLPMTHDTGLYPEQSEVCDRVLRAKLSPPEYSFHQGPSSVDQGTIPLLQ